jgi:hypothetical protein
VTEDKIDTDVQPFTIATILKKLVERDGYNFVLLGK